MFADVFSMTAAAAEPTSSFEILFSGNGRQYPKAGVYNDGVIAIVDRVLGERMLSRWQSILNRRNLVALVTTGLGNVFLSDRDSGELYFLDVQAAELAFVGNDPDLLLDAFIAHPGVLDEVIRGQRIEELIAVNRPLKYPECFILIPWLMLGGRDQLNKYDIGSCSVYVELVGQTHIKGALPKL